MDNYNSLDSSDINIMGNILTSNENTQENTEAESTSQKESDLSNQNIKVNELQNERQSDNLFESSENDTNDGLETYTESLSVQDINLIIMGKPPDTAEDAGTSTQAAPSIMSEDNVEDLWLESESQELVKVDNDEDFDVIVKSLETAIVETEKYDIDSVITSEKEPVLLSSIVSTSEVSLETTIVESVCDSNPVISSESLLDDLSKELVPSPLITPSLSEITVQDEQIMLSDNIELTDETSELKIEAEKIRTEISDAEDQCLEDYVSPSGIKDEFSSITEDIEESFEEQSSLFDTAVPVTNNDLVSEPTVLELQEAAMVCDISEDITDAINKEILPLTSENLIDSVEETEKEIVDVQHVIESTETNTEDIEPSTTDAILESTEEITDTLAVENILAEASIDDDFPVKIIDEHEEEIILKSDENIDAVLAEDLNDSLDLVPESPLEPETEETGIFTTQKVELSPKYESSEVENSEMVLLDESIEETQVLEDAEVDTEYSDNREDTAEKQDDIALTFESDLVENKQENTEDVQTDKITLKTQEIENLIESNDGATVEDVISEEKQEDLLADTENICDSNKSVRVRVQDPETVKCTVEKQKQTFIVENVSQTNSSKSDEIELEKQNITTTVLSSPDPESNKPEADDLKTEIMEEKQENITETIEHVPESNNLSTEDQKIEITEEEQENITDTVENISYSPVVSEESRIDDLITTTVSELVTEENIALKAEENEFNKEVQEPEIITTPVTSSSEDMIDKIEKCSDTQQELEIKSVTVSSTSADQINKVSVAVTSSSEEITKLSDTPESIPKKTFTDSQSKEEPIVQNVPEQVSLEPILGKHSLEADEKEQSPPKKIKLVRQKLSAAPRTETPKLPDPVIHEKVEIEQKLDEPVKPIQCETEIKPEVVPKETDKPTAEANEDEVREPIEVTKEALEEKSSPDSKSVKKQKLKLRRNYKPPENVVKIQPKTEETTMSILIDKESSISESVVEQNIVDDVKVTCDQRAEQEEKASVNTNATSSVSEQEEPSSKKLEEPVPPVQSVEQIEFSETVSDRNVSDELVQSVDKHQCTEDEKIVEEIKIDVSETPQEKSAELISAVEQIDELISAQSCAENDNQEKTTSVTDDNEVLNDEKMTDYMTRNMQEITETTKAVETLKELENMQDIVETEESNMVAIENTEIEDTKFVEKMETKSVEEIISPTKTKDETMKLAEEDKIDENDRQDSPETEVITEDVCEEETAEDELDNMQNQTIKDEIKRIQEQSIEEDDMEKIQLDAMSESSHSDTSETDLKEEAATMDDVKVDTKISEERITTQIDVTKEPLSPSKSEDSSSSSSESTEPASLNTSTESLTNFKICNVRSIASESTDTVTKPLQVEVEDFDSSPVESENEYTFTPKRRESESVPKIIIKPIPKREERSSPKITIKPIKPPGGLDSPKSSKMKSFDDSCTPRITIKPVLKTDPLKITFTKQKSDDTHSILKIYRPDENQMQVDDHHVPKLTIKSIPKVDEMQHSPRITIKPVKPPSSQQSSNISPKITVKPIPPPSDHVEITHSPKRSSKSMLNQEESYPKVTIKPVLRPDEAHKMSQLSPRQVKLKSMTFESTSGITVEPVSAQHSLSTPKFEQEGPLSPLKISVKPFAKIDENLSPKLTIKPITKTCEIVQSEDGTSSPRKLTIKPILKPEESYQSPKITIKPIVKPDDADQLTVEESEKPERIILKIQKTNLPSPSDRSSHLKESKKEPEIKIEAIPHDSDKTQKLDKIKLKLTKEGNHAQIISSPSTSETTFSLKRSLAFSESGVYEKRSKTEFSGTEILHTSDISINIVEPNAKPNPKTISEEVTIVKIDKSSSGSRAPLTEHISQSKFKEMLLKIQQKTDITCTPHIAHTEDSSSSDDVKIVEIHDNDPLKDPLSLHDESSSQDVMIVNEVISTNPFKNVQIISAQSVIEQSPQTPKKRGRPRKNPLEVKPEIKGEDCVEVRPKRTCRAPPGRTPFAVKERKPRGAGRGRGGSRGRGASKSPQKPPKEPKSPRAKALKEAKALAKLEASRLAHEVVIDEITIEDSTNDTPVATPVPPVEDSPKKPSEVKEPEVQIQMIEPVKIAHPAEESLKQLQPPPVAVYEEETRMSADNSSRAQTPARQVLIPTSAEGPEESQSSVLSTATTESNKNKKGRLEVCDPDSAVTGVEQIVEYSWGTGGPYMLQEQIAQFLGVKSFKRKYPGLTRRPVEMQERDYIREKGLVSESMCDMGLTAVPSSEILDIMYTDFQEKYEEYRKCLRDKQSKEIFNKQKAISLATSQEKTKLDYKERAIRSAANWNTNFNKTRKESRRCCMDLQTFTVNFPVGRTQAKVPHKNPVGHYPVALVPGQYTDYYKTYTSNELHYLPLNTVRYGPVLPNQHCGDAGQSDCSQSDSDSSSGSDSDSSDDSMSTLEDTPAPEIICKPASVHLTQLINIPKSKVH